MLRQAILGFLFESDVMKRVWKSSSIKIIKQHTYRFQQTSAKPTPKTVIINKCLCLTLFNSAILCTQQPKTPLLSA